YECVAFFFFFQAEDGIRDWSVTGVQTCALPISEEIAGGRDRGPQACITTESGCGHRTGLDGRAGVAAGQIASRRAARRPRPGERSEERRVGKEGRSRGSSDH